MRQYFWKSQWFSFFGLSFLFLVYCAIIRRKRCDADAFAETERRRSMRALPSLDRAETGVAQPGVKQADDSRLLIGVFAIRVTGIADRGRVLESDGMMQKEADSHPGVQTIDEFRSMTFMPSDIRYIIEAVREIEHRAVTQNQTQIQQALRGYAVRIVARALIGEVTGSRVSDPPESRPLESHLL